MILLFIKNNKHNLKAKHINKPEKIMIIMNYTPTDFNEINCKFDTPTVEMSIKNILNSNSNGNCINYYSNWFTDLMKRNTIRRTYFHQNFRRSLYTIIYIQLESLLVQIKNMEFSLEIY